MNRLPINSGSTTPAGGAGYVVIWEFLVKLDVRPAFEKAYGLDGDWAQLFCQSPEYRGTELLRDLGRPGRYITLDRWTSRGAFLRFKQSHQSAYAALDGQCEAFSDHEALVGEFEPPDLTGGSTMS